MKIFISGASGLVGRDLITYLLKENHKILATYRNRRKAQKEIAHKNLKWKKIDLKKPIKIKQKIDIIIHCAVAHPFSKKIRLKIMLVQTYCLWSILPSLQKNPTLN